MLGAGFGSSRELATVTVGNQICTVISLQPSQLACVTSTLDFTGQKPLQVSCRGVAKQAVTVRVSACSSQILTVCPAALQLVAKTHTFYALATTSCIHIWPLRGLYILA